MQCDHALEIVDVGVDWLTCTAPRGDPAEGLQEFGHLLMQQQVADGNRKSLWKGQGYHGSRSGAVAVGVRHDGCILRLSSSAAASHYRQATSLAGNVSRIDLQLTALDHSNLVDRAHLAYYQIDGAPRKGGRPPSASLRLNKGGGQTCYIGSRTSDVVGRLYDKGIESKTAPEGKLWRYELEYKGELSPKVAAMVSRPEAGPGYIAARVVGHFSDRGIPGPEIRDDPPTAFYDDRPTNVVNPDSDAGRSLRWLKMSVAPTVARLLECGRREEVLRVLGLDGQ